MAASTAMLHQITGGTTADWPESDSRAIPPDPHDNRLAFCAIATVYPFSISFHLPLREATAAFFIHSANFNESQGDGTVDEMKIRSRE